MKRALALLASAAVLAAVGGARANGRFPMAQHVAVGAEGRVVALRATFGVIVSGDHGKTFDFVCEEALGYSGEADPPIAVDALGRVHVGLFDGLVRTTPDRCGSARLTEGAGKRFTDLDHARDGSLVLALQTDEFVSGGASPRSRVFASRDGGQSFAETGAVVEGVLFDTLEHAPSDPARIWFAGVTTPPRRPVIYRTDDGGVTLRELAFVPGVNPAIDVESAFISGVDPTDPDVAWVRVVTPGKITDAGFIPPGSALLRTSDGGVTWSVLVRSDGPLLGFALADDGRTAWVGGPGVGLLRTDDAGATFTKVNDVGVRCLRFAEGTLWACGNDAADGFGLARSDDGGSTLQPVVRYCELAPLVCEGSATTTTTCAGAWSGVRALFGCAAPGTDAGADAPDAALEGGSDGSIETDASLEERPPSEDRRSSGCGHAPLPASGAFAALSLLFTLCASRARRRHMSR